MSKNEDLAARASAQTEVVQMLIEMARALRKKAEKLAAESDVFAAKAADDYATYLEEAADQWPRIQTKQKRR